MTHTLEATRHGVTPAQFLAYVRGQLIKKGIRDLASDLDLDYFRAGNDLNFYYHGEPEKPCRAERSISKPYEMQTYCQNWDGTVYNEICEFEFDDEKTGHGYYYLRCDDPSETEETSETETTDEGQQIEFRRLDDLGEYIGLPFPEEIHDFAAAEGWWKRNEQGDPELDRDELNDFLRRYGAGIVCRSLTGGICCEIVND